MKKCKFCGEEIQEAATKCRFCGEWLQKPKSASETPVETVSQTKEPSKKTNPVIKALGWIFFIIVMTAFYNGFKNANEKTAAVVAEKKKSAETIYKMKQDVNVGYFTYAVNSMTEKNEIGTSFYSKKPSGVYKIILLAALNNDKESRYLDSGMFKMKDSQGRVYDVSSEAGTALNMQMSSANKSTSINDLFLKQLNPSLSTVGFLVFDIPKDATGLKLEVSGGMLSSEKKYIELQ